MLSGKTVVITGAAAGIGRELALRLADEGADVWALDISEKGLAELTAEAAKLGLTLEGRAADVTDRARLAALAAEASKTRRTIDYWINNAGIALNGELTSRPLADFDKVIDVNLKGVVNGTYAALQVMETTGTGRIVNMASVAGHIPAPLMSAYCATKHAVVGFTRALQAELELKSSPLSTLLVSPGFVDTAIVQKGQELGFPEWLSFLLASPKEVADAVVKALPTKKTEIVPTFNGKLMRGMYSLAPGATVRSSRVMLTKSWKDVLFNRYAK